MFGKMLPKGSQALTLSHMNMMGMGTRLCIFRQQPKPHRTLTR